MTVKSSKCPECGTQGIPCKGGTGYVPKVDLDYLCPACLNEW